MPIFKAGNKLVQYAHVPKCGGSAVAWYLRSRFGDLAFADNRHTRHEPLSVWSRTSPQHIDAVSLGRLFPDGFFDATFTIVRHPVPRLISAYHFQLEVEKSISEQVIFSEWLEDIQELRRDNPFLYDNHVRPMSDIVPEGATVFHMEHGLDALIPWFDSITGQAAEPRAIPQVNKRGEYSGGKTQRAKPTQADLERIAEIYAADFERFGYTTSDTRSTQNPAPTLTSGFQAERDAALKTMNNPLHKLKSKLSARLKS